MATTRKAMNVYTAQEWQLKFKEQAGKDKQLLHDLNCTGLVRLKDVHELTEQIYDEGVNTLLRKQLEVQDLKDKITKANKILDIADFEDFSGAHKIHWSNWQALRLLLQGDKVK